MNNALSSPVPADFGASQQHTRGARPIRTWIVRGTTMLVLLLGFIELRAVMSDAPALSSDLRIVGPNGDWRPTRLFDFYDQSRYLENRVTVLLEASEIDPTLASAPLSLAIEAIDLAPANAYNWVNLAMASASFGMTDLAPLALQRSAALAPYNITLALQRLGLFDLLAQPLDEDMSTMVRRDLETVHAHAPSELAGLFEGSEALAAFAAENDLADIPEDAAETAGETAPQATADPAAEAAAPETGTQTGAPTGTGAAAVAPAPAVDGTGAGAGAGASPVDAGTAAATGGETAPQRP